MKVRTAIILILSHVASLHGVAALGQKASSAAKGDSPVREIVRGESNVNEDSSEKYRGAIKELGLDYKTLFDRFEEVRSVSRSQTFLNLIIAHLVARNVSPAEFDTKTSLIVEFMKKGKSLDYSLRQALSLNSADVRRYRHAAEKQLKSATGS